MTNHTEKNKEYVNSTLEYLKENRERLNAAECSYCTRDASQFAFFDQRNFVPIQGKVDEKGNQAYAIYGDCCLNDARKVADIKRAFVIDERGNAGYIPLYDLQNLDDIDDEELPPKPVPNPNPNESAVQKDAETGQVKPETVENAKEFPATSEEANKSVISTIPEKKEDSEPSLLEKLKLKKDNKDA